MPVHSTTTTSTDLRLLRSALVGTAFAPDSPGYENARQAWNLTVDQHPAVVVYADNAADVAVAIDYARGAGLQVAPQSTGHNAGPLGDLSGTLLLRTGAMNQVRIDAAARRATVGGGTLWQDVVAPASAAGLAPLAGSSPDVGVAGYSLGGGIGWLARRHGLAANSITAVEMVMADGERVRADHTTEPDLFWAVRGGGGNFGVVTELELELFPAAAVYAGAMFWPWEEAEAVLGAWRDWIRTVPDEVTSVGRLLQLPPIPDVPEPLRGRQLVAVELAFLGDEVAGADIVAPLRALRPEIDMVAMMPPTGLLQIHGDPVGPTPGVVDHALLSELTTAGIDAVLKTAGPGSGSPLVSMELRHLEGALSETPADAGALATIDGAFLAATVGVPMAPGDVEAIEMAEAEVMTALAPWAPGRTYLNFSERAVDTRTAFAADTHRRLARIRAEVDPDGIFRANHTINAAA